MKFDSNYNLKGNIINNQYLEFHTIIQHKSEWKDFRFGITYEHIFFLKILSFSSIYFRILFPNEFPYLKSNGRGIILNKTSHTTKNFQNLRFTIKY